MSLQHAVYAVLIIRRGVILETEYKTFISFAKLSAWKLSHRKALKMAVLPAVGMYPVVLMIVLSQGLSQYKREVIQHSKKGSMNIIPKVV